MSANIVEKVLETMLDEMVKTVVVFTFFKILCYDHFKLKDVIKHYASIREQGDGKNSGKRS
jgi:hypothetical protein